MPDGPWTASAQGEAIIEFCRSDVVALAFHNSGYLLGRAFLLGVFTIVLGDV
jgi:hypothetical protein